MKDSNFNQQKAEQFSESLVDILNKSAIAIALSLGHRCGLFAAMALDAKAIVICISLFSFCWPAKCF